jgi:uncharacterized protein
MSQANCETGTTRNGATAAVMVASGQGRVEHPVEASSSLEGRRASPAERASGNRGHPAAPARAPAGRIRASLCSAAAALFLLLPSLAAAAPREGTAQGVPSVGQPSLDEQLRRTLAHPLEATQLPAEMPAEGLNPAAISTLPSPAGRVSDFAGVLDERTRTAMLSLIDEVERRTSAELAVVTVPSTSPEGIDAYALRLFNTWGIGKRARDNGVLLLVAVGDRDVRIEVGIGLESTISDATAGEILDDAVVPRFRDGDMAGGLAAGLAEIAERVAPGSPAAVSFPVQPSHGCGATSWVPWTVAGSIAAALVGAFVGWRVWRRRRARTCPQCGQAMVRLSEAEEDACLSDLQKTEESVGSADWDVWRCAGCGHNFALRYNKWFNLYGDCPQCGGETLRSTRVVLERPTYISTGSGVRTQDCASCSYHDEQTYVIPVLARGSSGRSGGSHSSGGGGFGGGHSRGGGASRHW